MMAGTAAYSIAFTLRSVNAVEGDMTSKTAVGATDVVVFIGATANNARIRVAHSTRGKHLEFGSEWPRMEASRG